MIQIQLPPRPPQPPKPPKPISIPPTIFVLRCWTDVLYAAVPYSATAISIWE